MTAQGMCGVTFESNSNRDVRFEFESNPEASQVPIDQGNLTKNANILIIANLGSRNSIPKVKQVECCA